jgi:hypothetical protein
VNAWTLERFDKLRRDLAERGLIRDFCTLLADVVSPTGALTLFEAIDLSTPEDWREALRLLGERERRQLDLL